MHIMIETKEECCDRVKTDSSTVEWLIIHKALRMLADNESIADSDRQIAKKIIDTKPNFYER